MLLKCCMQYVSKFGKLSRGHRKSQKKGNTKECSNYQKLHSFHILVRLFSKSFLLGFSSMWTKNFQMYKLDLEKAEEPGEPNFNIRCIIEKEREFQKQTFFCFIDYVKAFDCVDHNKLWKILKEVGIPVHLICFLRTYMQINKQQWEMDMEKWTGSKSIKGNNKVLYCHPAYLFSMQSRK